MKKTAQGFTLIELVTVMILVGVISVVVIARIDSAGTAPVQSGRDDLIAALFFAQQQAMMRSNVTLVLTSSTISVNENNTPIKVSTDFYPLKVPVGVSLPVLTLSYDKLGRTNKTQIVLTGSGNSSGVTATIQVEASGYAYAQ